MKPMPIAAITRRGSRIVTLTPGLPRPMLNAIRAYPEINGRCRCDRVFYFEGQWRDSWEPPFWVEGSRLATIRK